VIGGELQAKLGFISTPLTTDEEEAQPVSKKAIAKAPVDSNILGLKFFGSLSFIFLN
jgi:hypothetical protein